jgi:predicted secreted protein
MKTACSFLVAALAGMPAVVSAAESVPTPVSLKVGQQISILLDGNATTGYMWQLAEKLPANSPVRVSISCAAQNDDTFCCGFPTPTTVTIAGIKAGKTMVRLVYARPWEKGKRPAAEECFSVSVKPADAGD